MYRLPPLVCGMHVTGRKKCDASYKDTFEVTRMSLHVGHDLEQRRGPLSHGRHGRIYAREGNEGGGGRAPPPRRMGLNNPKSETATTATAIAVASSAEEGGGSEERS